MMRHLFAVLLLCGVPCLSQAAPIVVGLVPIETGFTSTLTPNPTDIWHVFVEENDNIDPIFSMDLAIPGNFVQSPGAPTAKQRTMFGSGIFPVADTFFWIPSFIRASNVAIAPGTAVDNESLLAAAYTVVGDTPLIGAGEVGVTLAELAVPAGVIPKLPQQLGTAAVRTSVGPVAVEVVSFIVPEPTTLVLGSLALAAFVVRRRG